MQTPSFSFHYASTLKVISDESPAFLLRDYAVLARVSSSCPPLKGIFLRVTHPFATRHQPSKLGRAAVRLACVRHAASVQSEPGSNSSIEFDFAHTAMRLM